MRKNKFRDYSYSILLGVSLLVVGGVWQFGGFKEAYPKEYGSFLEDMVKDVLGDIFVEKESVFREEKKQEDLLTEVESADIAGLDPLEGGQEEPSISDLEKQKIVLLEEKKGVEFYHADISYFEDALFIGDSRTVGLYEYGGLGNAEVFAHSGMSIYKIFKEEFKLRNGETVTLEEALQKRKFGKVYIMLGINELGYDFEQTVKRFNEAIARIRKAQPDAIIFTQANLHITAEKSNQSEIFNNRNIDKYNQAIREQADGETVFYLDANILYDDENGCLSKKFTTDHAHILGKYYVDWVEFILQNAVRTE